MNFHPITKMLVNVQLCGHSESISRIYPHFIRFRVILTPFTLLVDTNATAVFTFFISGYAWRARLNLQISEIKHSKPNKLSIECKSPHQISPGIS